MSNMARRLAVAFALVLGSQSLGWAAEMSVARPARVEREDNYLRVDDRPLLLLWAQGLADPAEVADYRASGFNTLYVRVEGTSDEELKAAEELIAAAEDQDLRVAVALAPSALSSPEGERLPVSARDERYANAVADFVATVLGRLSSHPGIIAWLVEGARPEEVAWGDDGFRAFLQESYPSLERLNESWGSQLESWDQVTVQAAREIDSTFPRGVARASVDYAAYREQAYAEVVALWVNAVRAADPERAVLVSAITDYRSLASITANCDGFVLHVYPSVAEPDFDTHNVHAVDIGRRGNRFAVVQTLDVRAGDPAQVEGWAELALLHGAAGVAFSEWGRIRESEALQAMVRRLAEDFATQDGYPRTPLARAAILYTPIAGGAVRNGIGLYGYLDGFAPGEPTNLFSLVRTGTRYGLWDVLTVSSLAQANLADYGLIVAPAAFYLPESAQVALHNYVLGGGTLVVDAGAGMYQAEGNVHSMPTVLREMFGLRHADLRAMDPTLPPDYSGEAGLPDESSQGYSGLDYLTPVERGLEVPEDLVKLADAVEQIMGKSEVVTALGEEFTTVDAPPVRVRALGRGLAVYVPSFLYDEWEPTDQRYQGLHQRLLSRRADIEVTYPDALASPDLAVAVYRGWPVAVSTVGREAVVVDAFDAENQLYLVPGGAVRLFNPQEDTRTQLLFPPRTLVLARPLPVYVRPVVEGGQVTVAVLRYDPDRVEIALHGPGAQVGLAGDALRISGGEATTVEIEIRDGPYSVAAGTMHHLTLAEGPRQRVVAEQDIMPNPETGSLVITANVGWTHLILEQVTEEQ